VGAATDRRPPSAKGTIISAAGDPGQARPCRTRRRPSDAAPQFAPGDPGPPVRISRCGACQRTRVRERDTIVDVRRAAIGVLVVLPLLLLAACGRGPQGKAGSYPPTSLAPTSSATSVVPVNAPCVASQLTTSGGWQGATQTMLGGITISNAGDSPCFLQGYLGISLENGHGKPLAVEVTHRGTIGTSGLDGPVLTDKILLPSRGAEAAFLGLRWSNWCGPQPGRLTVELTVAGMRITVPPGFNGWGVTTCLTSQESSVLEEGPVQRPPA